jgi:hypothetical protein
VVKVALWGGGNAAHSLFFLWKKWRRRREEKRKNGRQKQALRARERDIIYTLSLLDDKMYTRSDHTRY